VLKNIILVLFRDDFRRAPRPACQDAID